MSANPILTSSSSPKDPPKTQLSLLVMPSNAKVSKMDLDVAESGGLGGLHGGLGGGAIKKASCFVSRKTANMP